MPTWNFQNSILALIQVYVPICNFQQLAIQLNEAHMAVHMPICHPRCRKLI